MHQDGELDIRGVYCALSVARLTNIYSPVSRVASFLETYFVPIHFFM